MNELLHDAFRHAAWATQSLIRTCRELSAEQLLRPARGYGSLLATLNHVVQSDAHYAAIFAGMQPDWAKEGNDTDDLDVLEARAEEVARTWSRILDGAIDADRVIVLDAGAYECRASVVVAQALHHGCAHREQVRAGLAELGVKPPDLQPWAYALDVGRARWRRGKS